MVQIRTAGREEKDVGVYHATFLPAGISRSCVDDSRRTFSFSEMQMGDAKPGAVTQKGEAYMVENTVSTIFVWSPYQPQSREPVVARDQLVSNIEQVKMAFHLIVKLGFLPLASHPYFTGFLDDTVAQEREKGMELGQKWVHCRMRSGSLARRLPKA